MADPKEVARKDGRARRTVQVHVEPGYFVDPDYDLTLCEHEEIEPTGRLKVLELQPKDPTSTAARFIGRWDAKANLLDIDPVDVNGHVLDKSAPRPGHHPERLPDRHFSVNVDPAGKVIFRGEVSFGLGHDLDLGGTIPSSGTVVNVPIRGRRVRVDRAEAASVIWWALGLLWIVLLAGLVVRWRQARKALDSRAEGDRPLLRLLKKLQK